MTSIFFAANIKYKQSGAGQNAPKGDVYEKSIGIIASCLDDDGVPYGFSSGLGCIRGDGSGQADGSAFDLQPGAQRDGRRICAEG